MGMSAQNSFDSDLLVLICGSIILLNVHISLLVFSMKLSFAYHSVTPASIAQCSLQEASVRLRHEWMREALHFWIQRQGWDLVMEQITASAKDTTAPAPSNSSIMPLAQKA